MTSIDQGSTGETFNSGFITEANQENSPKVFKDEEICPQVPKEEEQCPQVHKEEESCVQVPKKEEKCPEVPQDDNVQVNSINMDDLSNENVSNESPNANETKNLKTFENCVSDETENITVVKEIGLKATVNPVEAVQLVTDELAESNIILGENNIETKEPSVVVETPSADEKSVGDVEITDDDGISKDNSAKKLDIELIPTNNISEEAIDETAEKAVGLDIDQKDVTVPESTSDVRNTPTVEKNTSNYHILDDCMAGAGDSGLKDVRIEEKLIEKDMDECPVAEKQPNTNLDVVNEAKSLSLNPESEKNVLEITVVDVENLNSEGNIDETDTMTGNDKIDSVKILDVPHKIHEPLENDENALDEPLRFEDSLELDEKILDEALESSIITDIESPSKLTINTQSVPEKLGFSAETISLDTAAEKSAEEKLHDSEVTVKKLGSDVPDILSMNIELGSKSSESTVAKTSSSEAIEAKSDESISSDDNFDSKTCPVELDSSKKDQVCIKNTVESKTLPLETIIEETKSAEIIPESSKSEVDIPATNVRSADEQESINVDDVDMEPVVSDTSKEENMSIDCDDSISFVTANDNDDVSIVSDTKDVGKSLDKTADKKFTKEKSADDDKQKISEVTAPGTNSNDTFKIQLSNNLDILSDDEDESSKQAEKQTPSKTLAVKDSQDLEVLSDDDEKSSKPLKSSEIQSLKTFTAEDSKDKTINLDDDDEIMLIDDDTSAKDIESNVTSFKSNDTVDSPIQANEQDQITIDSAEVKEPAKEEKEGSTPEPTATAAPELSTEKTENPTDTAEGEPKEKRKPLVPENFFKSYKRNLREMSRNDLEEFCILKIVESIIDKSTLNDINNKLKFMAQSVEEYKKKVLSMNKQHRDLQVVLKSVQEEQKNNGTTPITPLKITRSVGMQVLMTDKNRRKPASSTVSNQNISLNNAKQSPKPKPKPPAKLPKLPAVNTIPVPRLVPASNVAKVQTPNKPMTNGIKTPPVQKPEKRTHSRMNSQSVTVDLTDDEPPAKVVTKSPGQQPVRLVPPQNLMTARGPNFTSSSPRKVFIPISGPGSQQLRPGQTIMVKNIPGGPRVRNPSIRPPQNGTRMRVPAIPRHPAPLPDAMKQYQPPNWKALPPAPELKLSKVDNGIVISWKIEGYLEDSYEEIASYQLFAYQETSAPPNTNLWKKIGDVKALPLPMACTLTQFMAGYKYYFAVRAVDIRSRLGPFSMPGSILLLNKM